MILGTPFTINLLNPSPSSSSSSSSTTFLRLPTTITTASASASSSDTQTLPQSAIRRIADKLRSLGYVEDTCNNNSPKPAPSTSFGQIFVPLPTHLPKYRVGHTLDDSWSTPQTPVPTPGSGNAIQRYNALLDVAMKEKEEDRVRRRGMERKERVPSLAELALSRTEMKRLISLGVGMRHKLKVGKAGITEGIVNGIHERWRASEVVKIRCEDVCRLNMKRTHDLLEV